MIAGWLLKVVVGIALAGLVLIELGAPLIARAQADDAAHHVAANAAREIVEGHTPEDARAAALEVAATEGVILDGFSVEPGAVRVTVSKQAKSYVLRRFAATRDWYDIEVTAASGTTIR